MRWPFFPFKVDAGFGEPRDYGLHDGADLNGLLGGNTDCGTPLFPVLEGLKIHLSYSNFGFGNIFVYKITFEGRDYYIRYCHVSSILWGQPNVEQVNPVALMGTTGNSTACHLHVSVFKKLPVASNWRMIAKTRQILNEYFIDPILFFKQLESGSINVPGVPSMNYEELGRRFEVLMKRYGKGSFADFDFFITEHLGTDGQGGFLKSEREEVRRLREQIATMPGTGPSWPTGYYVDGYIVKKL